MGGSCKSLTAFTLAEVLIVLGIIGLIADMTIPTLVATYQKQVVVTRMQKMFSSINQAIRLSEVDNGAFGEWDIPTAYYSYNAILPWYQKYLEKYLRVVKYEETTVAGVASMGSIKLYFSDGSALVLLYCSGMFHAWFYPVADKYKSPTRDIFAFFIVNGNFVQYASSDFTRTQLLEDGTYGCKNGLPHDKRFCSSLIMRDGWKISDDYPW